MKKKLSDSWPMYLFFLIVIIALVSIILYLLLKSPSNCPYVCPVPSLPPQSCSLASCPPASCSPSPNSNQSTSQSTNQSTSQNTNQSTSQSTRASADLTDIRDRRVIADPLYPPLNRSDRYTFETTVDQTNARNINVPTNDYGDSYRLVGYLVCKDQTKDAGGNNWKLMARQKNRHESDFYIIPTNRDYDVKVPLTPEVVVGTRLRDLYSIPSQISFNSPMLNQEPYDFIEIPKTTFDPRYI